MAHLAAAGVPLTVVAVTDGEASHARSRRVDAAALVARRAAERDEALRRLGVAPAAVHRLGLPDGGLARGGHERRLADALAAILSSLSPPAGRGPRPSVLVPWRHDGHPDHEATARAALAAAARTGARVGEVMIWATVAGTVPDDGATARFLPGASLAARKRHAAAAFASQLVAQGPSPLDGPVVHPHELAALLAGPEAVRW
jgi:LmbE family N-acetylglucosaminyl deacetylase